MILSNNIQYLITLLILSGFADNPNIQDQTLNDRVKACSSGFSESIRGSLDASLDKSAINSKITGETRQETKSLIFDAMPEKDRLKAYEDYIVCIEKHWNQ